MKDFTIKNKKILLTIASILLIYLVLWISSIIFNNALVFPNPNVIINSFILLLLKPQTYTILGSTFLRLLISTSIAFIFAFILGVFSGLFKDVEILLNPFILIFKSIPIIAIVIIIMSISGFDKTPYVVTILMVFPLIYQSVIVGIRNVNKEYIEVYQLDSKVNLEVVKLVYIPLIKESLYLGILQSIGIGIKVLVVTEFMVSTKNSIGQALIDEKNNLEFGNVFAYGVMLILIVVLLEKISNKFKTDKKKIS